MDLDFALQNFPRLLKATILTIELTLISLFFGIFVGVFFAILRTSKSKILFFYIILLFIYFERDSFIGSNFHNIFWAWSS